VRARTRESLVWGLLGGLTVLVVGLGSMLGGPGEFALTTVVGTALVVAAVTMVIAYRFAPSLT
jgi:hypothetical protein